MLGFSASIYDVNVFLSIHNGKLDGSFSTFSQIIVVIFALQCKDIREMIMNKPYQS